MNQAIQFQNASLPHTTSSESPTIRREISPVAPTNYGNVLRIECAVVYPPIPNRYADLNSLVNKYESNALRRDALIRARGRLAESLDSDGATLATLRLSRGMSQAKLAELIGTSQSRLSSLERGIYQVERFNEESSSQATMPTIYASQGLLDVLFAGERISSRRFCECGMDASSKAKIVLAFVSSK